MKETRRYSLHRGVWTHQCCLHRQVWTPCCSLHRLIQTHRRSLHGGVHKNVVPTTTHWCRLHRRVWTHRRMIHGGTSTSSLRRWCGNFCLLHFQGMLFITANSLNFSSLCNGLRPSQDHFALDNCLYLALFKSYSVLCIFIFECF